MSRDAVPRRRGVFYGWWVVAACFVIGAYIGGVYFFGFSVFFQAIVDEFGWSRAATALAFSLASLEGGFEGLLIGPLVDRYGPRRLMLIGIVIVGFAFLGLSRLDSVATYYAVYLLLAVGANTANGIAPTAAVANWFLRRRSLAFGVLATGFSFGGVMVPTLGWLVGSLGWRATAVVIGIASWALGVPLSALVRRDPESYGYRPDGEQPASQPRAAAPMEPAGHIEVVASRPYANANDFTLKDAMVTRAFWLLSLAFALRHLSLSAVVAHQVPLLVDRGFDAQTASNLLGMLALMGMPGRLLFGILGDRYRKNWLFAFCLGLQAVALLVLIGAASFSEVFVFSVLFGIAWGAVPLMLGLRADYFGRTAFATIGGVLQAFAMIGNFVGPVFAGWARDTLGSYEMAFLAFAVAAGVALVASLLATPPTKRMRVGR